MPLGRIPALVRSTTVAFLGRTLAGHMEYDACLAADSSGAWGEARLDAAWAVKPEDVDSSR